MSWRGVILGGEVLLGLVSQIEAGSEPIVSEFELPSETSAAWDFGGRLETTFWSTGAPAAGFVGRTGQSADPRLVLELDVRPNDNWYFHATARADQGFDPVSQSRLEARVDEILLRYSPFGDNTLNIQVGKFATVFGSWVNDHGYFDDAFLSGPLPYSQITSISVENPNALLPQAISNRANGLTPGLFDTPSSSWASVVWGPSYGTGISLFGQKAGFDYAFEVKNFGLTQQAEDWDSDLEGFENPTFTGRVGHRPNASLSYGFSASRGPYLVKEAERLLPDGVDIGDLPYLNLGFDFRWGYRDLIFSGEVIASQYETLGPEDLRSLSYYTQMRLKIAPGIWFAGRWGQSFHQETIGGDGERVEWSPDLWRLSGSVGWRATPELLIKTEYNYTSIDDDSVDAQHLFGLGVSYQF